MLQKKIYGLAKGVGGSAVAYAVSNGLLSAAQLCLFFLCAFMLPKAEFGVFALFMVVVPLGTQLLGMGLTASYQREFFILDEQEIAQYLSTITVAIIGVSVIAIVGSLLLMQLLKVIVGFPTFALFLAVLASLGQALQQLMLVTWQNEGERQSYFLYMIGFGLFAFITPFIFLLLFGLEWTNAAAGVASVFFVGGLLSIKILARKGYLIFNCRKDYLKLSLTYSLPLIPHQLSGWGMAMFDRFIITLHSGIAVAGYYSLAFQVAQLINIVSAGFNQAFAPWLYSALSKKDSTQASRIRMSIFLYCGAIIFIAIAGYMFFYAFVKMVPSPAYTEAIKYSPFLFLAMAFNAYYRIASNFILYAGRTGVLASATLLSAVVSIVLNSIFVPIYGAIASSYILAITFFGLMLMSFIVAGNWLEHERE